MCYLSIGSKLVISRISKTQESDRDVPNDSLFDTKLQTQSKVQKETKRETMRLRWIHSLLWSQAGVTENLTALFCIGQKKLFSSPRGFHWCCIFNHDNGSLDNDLNDVIRVPRVVLKNSAEGSLCAKIKVGTGMLSTVTSCIYSSALPLRGLLLLIRALLMF